MANGHLAYVAHANGHALIRPDHNVSNVVGVANQADATHVVELPPLRIEAASRIRIVRSQRCCHLRHGQVVAVDPRRIEQHLILHRHAAEA